ncbi:hypothetical protein [Kutzneria sp. CA-103260]|uniref:hypothetical protein n=1 Tax=Kutzneria sp. CA-103260 TaxID=2802641 RepID=UPI001BA80D59|nr:hypothetical protein [Kutzneria sp. CA-103260]
MSTSAALRADWARTLNFFTQWLWCAAVIGRAGNAAGDQSRVVVGAGQGDVASQVGGKTQREFVHRRRDFEWVCREREPALPALPAI